MILAAGRGERMRPLTDVTPKPLLKVGGKALIEYSLENLADAGFCDVIVNIAYLGWQIREFCGDGSRWDLSIQYSDEGESALETAGGIVKALPMLSAQAFLVINADVICDYPLAHLRNVEFDLAHLVMIHNPPHHPAGDFSLDTDGQLGQGGERSLTFSGIGLYRPAMFDGIAVKPLKLRPVLDRAIAQKRVSGECYDGVWLDVGTPQRLQSLATGMKL